MEWLVPNIPWECPNLIANPKWAKIQRGRVGASLTSWTINIKEVKIERTHLPDGWGIIVQIDSIKLRLSCRNFNPILMLKVVFQGWINIVLLQMEHKNSSFLKLSTKVKNTEKVSELSEIKNNNEYGHSTIPSNPCKTLWFCPRKLRRNMRRWWQPKIG